MPTIVWVIIGVFLGLLAVVALTVCMHSSQVSQDLEKQGIPQELPINTKE